MLFKNVLDLSIYIVGFDIYSKAWISFSISETFPTDKPYILQLISWLCLCMAKKTVSTRISRIHWDFLIIRTECCFYLYERKWVAWWAFTSHFLDLSFKAFIFASFLLRGTSYFVRKPSKLFARLLLQKKMAFWINYKNITFPSN